MRKSFEIRTHRNYIRDFNRERLFTRSAVKLPLVRRFHLHSVSANLLEEHRLTSRSSRRRRTQENHNAEAAESIVEPYETSINCSPERVKVTAGVLQIFTHFYLLFTIGAIAAQMAADAGAS